MTKNSKMGQRASLQQKSIFGIVANFEQKDNLTK